MKKTYITLLLVVAVFWAKAQDHRQGDQEVKSEWELKPMAINSIADEFSGKVFNGDLYFVSNREASNLDKRNTDSFDLFINREGDSLPDLFSTRINTHKDEGAFSIYDHGNQIIFSRNESAAGNKNKTKLYHAERDLKKGKWRKAKVLNLGEDRFTYAHPVVSEDGSKLYFSSNMTGTVGGADIFLSEWRDGSWSTPVHLSEEINTKGNEFASYCNDAGELYFSSNGLNIKTDHDIYKAIPSESQYTVTKLSGPVNSQYDDFGITFSGNRTFFASNRMGGKGGFDLYELIEREIAVVEVSKPEILEEVFVVEEKQIEKESINIIKFNSGVEENSISWIFKKDGELIKENLDGSKQQFSSNRYAVEEVYLLSPVYFGLNEYRLTSIEKEHITQLVDLLKNHPGLTVKLRGYTDGTGSEFTNEKLRKQRAESVRNYLIQSGIASERIVCSNNQTEVSTEKGEDWKQRRTDFSFE
ncbi:MAG: OmpA family protein [Bacteroidota bacterium]